MCYNFRNTNYKCKADTMAKTNKADTQVSLRLSPLELEAIKRKMNELQLVSSKKITFSGAIKEILKSYYDDNRTNLELSDEDKRLFKMFNGLVKEIEENLSKKEENK